MGTGGYHRGMKGRGRDRVARGGRNTVRARARRNRRILRTGLVLSAALHLLIIGMIGGLLERPPTPRSRPSALYVEPPRGMRAVALSPAPSAAPTESAAPRQPVRDDDVLVPVPAPVETGPDDARPADARSAADRLAPRLIDPRLWRPVVLIPREPTLADVQARLDAAMELLSDSALAETERAMRAVDWTVEDADGGRWGISPGKLHLGKLTLPLPIYFTVPGWDPEQAEWYDLEAQVDRTRFLDSFEDRVRAIRERRDRERTERQGGEGGDVAGHSGGGG